MEVLVFDSRRGLGIFLFTTASRTALGPTQASYPVGIRYFSLGVKRPWSKADHSPPPTAEVEWSYTSTPQYTFMVWCSVKKKHRNTFTFTIL
jgi:hypothetical protein